MEVSTGEAITRIDRLDVKMAKGHPSSQQASYTVENRKHMKQLGAADYIYVGLLLGSLICAIDLFVCSFVSTTLSWLL